MSTFLQLSDPTNPIRRKEWETYLQRRRELVAEIEARLGLAQNTSILSQTSGIPEDAVIPLTPQQRQTLSDAIYNGLLSSGAQLPGAPKTPEPILNQNDLNDLLGVAEYYGIKNPEQFSPQQLQAMIEERRAAKPPLSADELRSGEALENRLIASPVVGGVKGLIDLAQRVPFIGDALERLSAVQKADQFFSKMQEALSSGLPEDAEKATRVAQRVGQVVGQGVAYWAAWEAAAAQLGVSTALVGSAPAIARTAAVGALSTAAFSGDLDTPWQDRALEIGIGAGLGGLFGFGGRTAAAAGGGLIGAAAGGAIDEDHARGALIGGSAGAAAAIFLPWIAAKAARSFPTISKVGVFEEEPGLVRDVTQYLRRSEVRLLGPGEAPRGGAPEPPLPPGFYPGEPVRPEPLRTEAGAFAQPGEVLAPEQEKISGVALQMKDGTILSLPNGNIHADVFSQKAEPIGYSVVDIHDKGFVTSTGRYVGRSEASDIAFQAQQYADARQLVDAADIAPAAQKPLESFDVIRIDLGLKPSSPIDNPFGSMTEPVTEEDLAELAGLMGGRASAATPKPQLIPAFRLYGKQILSGPERTHGELALAHPEYAELLEDPDSYDFGLVESGFVDQANNFYTREEATNLLGVETRVAPGELHATDFLPTDVTDASFARTEEMEAALPKVDIGAEIRAAQRALFGEPPAPTAAEEAIQLSKQNAIIESPAVADAAPKAILTDADVAEAHVRARPGQLSLIKGVTDVPSFIRALEERGMSGSNDFVVIARPGRSTDLKPRKIKAGHYEVEHGGTTWTIKKSQDGGWVFYDKDQPRVVGQASTLSAAKSAIGTSTDHDFIIGSPDLFDAVGKSDLVRDYLRYGLFSGQRVTTPDGFDATVIKPGEMTTVRLTNGQPETIYSPEDLMPAPSSHFVREVPQLYDEFRSFVMDHMNEETAAGGLPQFGWLDPETSSQLPHLLERWLTLRGYEDEGVRAGIAAYFDQARVGEYRNLAPPEDLALNDELEKAAEAAVVKMQLDRIDVPASVEEMAAAKGFFFQKGPALPETKVVDENGLPKMVAHGTPKVFDEFDLQVADPDALFGPGAYFTENLGEISSGYAMQGNPGITDVPFAESELEEYIEEILGEIEARSNFVERGIEPPDRFRFVKNWTHQEKQDALNALSNYQQLLENIRTPGYFAENAPNVRLALLDIRRPFDMDAPVSPEESMRIAQAMLEYHADTFPMGDIGRQQMVQSFAAFANTGFSRGGQLFDFFARQGLSIHGANLGLRRAGYDGITHIGGARTGNDPHRVWIAFSSDQIKSPWQRESYFLKDRLSDLTVPVESEEAAKEFLRNFQREMPDITPASDVPVEVMDLVPGGANFTDGVQPEYLGAEQHFDSLERTAKGLSDALDEIEASGLEINEDGSFGFAGDNEGFQNPPPPPPQLPASSSSPGGKSPKRQFQDLARNDVRRYAEILHVMDSNLNRWISPFRNLMLVLEEKSQAAGVDFRPWSDYADIVNARDQAHNFLQPFFEEFADITSHFKSLHQRDGTVVKIEEIPNYNDKLRAMMEANYTPEQIEAQMSLRPFFDKAHGTAKARGLDIGYVFDYIPHIRNRLSIGGENAWRDIEDMLPRNLKWFALYAREGGMQHRNVDINSLGAIYLRGLAFELFMKEPWLKMARTVDQEGMPEAIRGPLKQWLELVRTGINPHHDIAIQGVRHTLNAFGLPVTDGDLAKLYGTLITNVYRGMIGGSPYHLFRDSIQPFFLGTEIGFKWVTRAMREWWFGDQEKMWELGIKHGWIEKGMGRLPTVEPFSGRPVSSAGVELFSPKMAARREMFAKIGDFLVDARPRFLRHGITGTIVDPLRWYTRLGEWERAVSGWAGWLKAEDAFERFSNGELDYKGLLYESGASIYQKPIQDKFERFIAANDWEGAQVLLAQEAANAMFRYGTAEASIGIQSAGTLGRFGMQFGNFSSSYFYRLRDNIMPGVRGVRTYLSGSQAPVEQPLGVVEGQIPFPRETEKGDAWNDIKHTAAFLVRQKIVMSAITAAAAYTGWKGLEKWQWYKSLSFAGGPLFQAGSELLGAGTGFVAAAVDQPLSPQQRNAVAQLGITNPFELLNPYSRTLKTIRGITESVTSINPLEATARFLTTGEAGIAPDLRDYLHNQWGTTPGDWSGVIQTGGAITPAQVSGGVPLSMMNPQDLQQEGVSDPTKVYLKDGHPVYDTPNQTSDGHVPTHRLDAPSGRMPGESWEQYEARVISTPDSVFPAEARSVNRDTMALQPRTKEAIDQLLGAAREAGFNFAISETFRPQVRQEWLFKEGRSPERGGSPVTWTLTSAHTSGNAVDLVSRNPAAYKWLWENAGRFGLETLGPMDPGHVYLSQLPMQQQQGYGQSFNLNSNGQQFMDRNSTGGVLTQAQVDSLLSQHAPAVGAGFQQ